MSYIVSRLAAVRSARNVLDNDFHSFYHNLRTIALNVDQLAPNKDKRKMVRSYFITNIKNKQKCNLSGWKVNRRTAQKRPRALAEKWVDNR